MQEAAGDAGEPSVEVTGRSGPEMLREGGRTPPFTQLATTSADTKAAKDDE